MPEQMPAPSQFVEDCGQWQHRVGRAHQMLFLDVYLARRLLVPQKLLARLFAHQTELQPKLPLQLIHLEQTPGSQ